MRRKNFKSIIGLLMVLLFIASAVIPASAANGVEREENTVVIEVLTSEFDDDYIRNIEFADGTRVGDFNYVIIHRDIPQSRHFGLGQHFHFAGWITRDGVISISLDPIYAARHTTQGRDAAWNALRCTANGLGSDSRWRNEASLHAQYRCHYTWAANKDRWNLEPHRTSTNIIWTTIRGCNP